VTNIPPGMTFPYQDNPKSEVHPVLVLELTNPARRFYVRCSELLAVHKCVGKLNAAQVAP
jgi:hypothetical protein